MLSRRAACLVLKPPPRIPVRSILTASSSGKPVVVVGVEQVGEEEEHGSEDGRASTGRAWLRRPNIVPKWIPSSL